MLAKTWVSDIYFKSLKRYESLTTSVKILTHFRGTRVRSGDIGGWPLEACWTAMASPDRFSYPIHIFCSVDIAVPKHMTVFAS